MDPLDEFIKKTVLHNKLADDSQINLAEENLSTFPGKNLGEVLIEVGGLKPSLLKQLMGMWAKKHGGNPPPYNPTITNNSNIKSASKVDDKPVVAKTVSVKHRTKPIMPKGAIVEYFKAARKAGASDVHINAESKVLFRVNGRLKPVTDKPLPSSKTESLIFEILTEPQKEILNRDWNVEFSMSLGELGRFRCSVVKQRVGYDGAFRLISMEVPTFESLGLPDDLKRLTQFHQGLVLITGPNGCGKTSTMAAMADIINSNNDDHILSIEEPVEIVIPSKKCQVNQREVGSHTKSFANALRGALREDPDVIMIGELRDLETMSLAITAAETGHLVFGTLHTTSAAKTINRVLDVFPPDEQSQIRSMISESIKGIVCQQLIPRADGKGRALALEIMFNNNAVGNLIRRSEMHQMTSVMQTSKKDGMVMLDDSLKDLLAQGIINGEDAYFAADNKALFSDFKPET